MAAFTDTTRPRLEEGAMLPVLGFTPVAVAFSRFVAMLPALIEAERELGDYTGHDPAVDPWIRAAEAARKRTLAQIDDVLEGAAAQPGDAALHAAAQLFRQVMLSESADEVTWLRRQAARRVTFLLPETGIAPVRLNRLVLAALIQLEAYIALDDVPAEEPEAAFRPTPDYAEVPAA